LFTVAFYCCQNLSCAKAQSVALASKTSPTVEFTFNTISKYVNGITIPNALTLNIDADLTQWDLYVGATTVSAGEWDITTQYSNNGSDPAVELMEIRLRNFSNTSQASGFFPLTDIVTPTYIIGSSSVDTTVNCSDVSPTGTNAEGDYLTDPECYKFNVDLRIVPGLSHRAGLYTLRVDFMLVPDL
jgi:hypothetical protein